MGKHQRAFHVSFENIILAAELFGRLREMYYSGDITHEEFAASEAEFQSAVARFKKAYEPKR